MFCIHFCCCCQPLKIDVMFCKTVRIKPDSGCGCDTVCFCSGCHGQNGHHLGWEKWCAFYTSQSWWRAPCLWGPAGQRQVCWSSSPCLPLFNHCFFLIFFTVFLFKKNFSSVSLPWYATGVCVRTRKHVLVRLHVRVFAKKHVSA